MTLILTIENERSLPNGAPIRVRLSDKRGLDIGRSSNVDWTLPDPTRFISGKHCEVRYRDEAYWLHDVSTNGTFLNDDPRRIQAPYRLCHGDRLTIGPYIVAVETDDGYDPLTDAPLLGSKFERGTTDAEWVAGTDAEAIAAHANDKTGVPKSASSTKPLDAHGKDVQALEMQAWTTPDRHPRGTAGDPGDQQPESRQGPAPEKGPTLDDFLRRFAAAAGVPEHILARRDPLSTADELGSLMRIAVENITQLLNARVQTKRFVRASSQTTIQALDNNPLKFAPTYNDALKIMLGPRTSAYLDAKRAFESAFTDLKTHQITTFSAMQQAVRMLVEDLEPAAIQEAVGPETGLAALFSSRKARAWDMYVARWQAKSLRHEDGLMDAFMLYFAECYDRAKDKD
ncbi:type VI secretion system-associated FHA domain protein TagH [Beijerinckiaceae bacterium]|nr:type VI secretion system-associated FHA domain protein TagH [Beijerinckiaceae bacterium]